MALTSRPFGISRDGEPRTLWTLRAGALEADVTDHGATLVALRLHEDTGQVIDLVLGHDDTSGYESERNQYFGCTVGRVANRIAHAQFELDGALHALTANDGPHHLHGGSVRSFDQVRWRCVRAELQDGAPTLLLSHTSPHGEGGYPGHLTVHVRYRLLESSVLELHNAAETDRRTPLNLTNHSYWNLAGAGAESLEGHLLRIAADRYTPVDAALIPTGEILDVTGTDFDFRAGRMLLEAIAARAGQDVFGFDHNLVLEGGAPAGSQIEVRHVPSGRALRITTDQPAVQLYTGNFLHGAPGKARRRYLRHSALCLETQHYPDAVHHAEFPSTILEPGQRYETWTQFSFASEREA